MSVVDEEKRSSPRLAVAAVAVFLASIAAWVVPRQVLGVRDSVVLPMVIVFGLIGVVASRWLWVRAYPGKHPYAFRYAGIKSIMGIHPKGYWALVAIIFTVIIGWVCVELVLEQWSDGAASDAIGAITLYATYLTLMLIPKTRRAILSELRKARDWLSSLRR